MKHVWLEDNVSHVQMMHGVVLNPGDNVVEIDEVADALLRHGPPFYPEKPGKKAPPALRAVPPAEKGGSS